MRLFVAVRHSNDPSQYYGHLWSGNFYPALRELGHEIVESSTDLLPTSRFMAIPGGFTAEELAARAQTTEQILAEITAAHRRRPLDAVLTYFYNSHFDPAGFAEIAKLGVPTINFYCNSLYQFPNVAAIAAKVDWSWHAERDARSSYLAAGARPIWVQMGADPAICRPIDAPRERKACFVGMRYADRDQWALGLVRAGIPLALYGSGWGVASPTASPIASDTYLGRRQLRPASFNSYLRSTQDALAKYGLFAGARRMVARMQYRRTSRAATPVLAPLAQPRAADLSAVFARYEVCLNFSNVWADGEPGAPLIPHVRLRDFEAPMSRTCYLTGDTDEIRQFYDVGREIDTYRTLDELVEKTRFYLNDTAAAERLREAGYRRARRDHTWTRRFEELFRKCGLTS